MLKLEKLQICGFKSFSDRTEISFPAGITAVVGPNGCGKSNIGDAINWVLGEQSPKMLRGRQMVDVIFNGSETRKPLGLAEVSLHFANAEGAIGGESGKLVLTRKLYRTGESEYRINGQRARLKDVQGLLEQGHVGARSYATIEQGRIDQILNAKPKDRRQIIEDAAGIGGYKHKRRLAEMKLDATHANLLRVNDIIVEVERSIRSLKRQASRARRYRSLREELRDKERVRFSLRALELDSQLESLRKREADARESEAEVAAGLGKSEVSLVEQRGEHERLQNEFRVLGETVHQLELETDRSEGLIKSCIDRIEEALDSATRQRAEGGALQERLEEAEAQLTQVVSRVAESAVDTESLSAKWDDQRQAVAAVETRRTAQRETVERLRQDQFRAMNEAAELRNRLTAIEEGLERSGAQRARTESELQQTGDDVTRILGESRTLDEQCAHQADEVVRLSTALATAEAGVNAIREAHDRQAKALAEAREAEKSAVARLHTLEDIDTRFAGVSDGVRMLLHDGPAAGVQSLGVVADYVAAHSDIESAAEGYLRNFLPTVIVNDDQDIERASELLHRKGAGRTTLISKNHPSGGAAVGTTSNGVSKIPENLLKDPRVRGRLRDRLDLKTSGNGVVGNRIGDALIVDDLTTALELHRLHPGIDYLTTAGDVVYTSGVVATGGREQREHGLLAHRRKSEEARQRVEETGQVARQAQQQTDGIREEQVALEITVRESRQALDEATHKRVELDAYSRRTREEGERAGRKREVLDEEIEVANREIADLGKRQAATLQELARVEGQGRTLDHDLTQAMQQADSQESEARQLGETVSALRVELASRTQQLQAAEQERTRLQEARDELKRRVHGCRTEAEAADLRSEEASQLKSETDTTLVSQLEERRRSTDRAGEMERRLLELQQNLGEMDNGLKKLRDRLEAEREITRELELERTKKEADRAHLDELCEQELGVPCRDAGDPMENPEAVDLDALERECDEIRGKIERIGPVNMTAIDEFSEYEERYDFLSKQKLDLEQSMNSLRESIRRINRTSRDKFEEAFEKVRKSFQEIFKLLFNGGRADLRLEEGEDVLDCGIEIMVQPPGKRLGSIALMSGGEKALSAIALLFAVFRYRPSPFCLLDEVDAALDDANVQRFARMLKEYAQQTQFIVVTHNKLSMESADLLYGVTMEEPGVSKLVSIQLQ